MEAWISLILLKLNGSVNSARNFRDKLRVVLYSFSWNHLKTWCLETCQKPEAFFANFMSELKKLILFPIGEVVINFTEVIFRKGYQS